MGGRNKDRRRKRRTLKEFQEEEKEEERGEEEEFITSGNWGGKRNPLSRGAGADRMRAVQDVRTVSLEVVRS